MIHHRLGKQSLENLKGVHPRLIQLVVATLIISKYDFGITCGVRTVAQQQAEVDEGDSTTMHSKHLVQLDGYSHAIDFMVYVNGKGTWKMRRYRKVMQAFVTAAIDLGIHIELGGLWESLVDGPHIQLKSL